MQRTEKNLPRIPIAHYFGYSQKPDGRLGTWTGYWGQRLPISKPFSKDEFLARVKTHLNLHNINRATGKFVPYEFIKALGKNTITEVQLGDQIQQEVTIFFSDIRDYTSLAEQLSPKETFSLVNAYTYRLGPIIRSKAGFITNYLGDGIVALFPKTPDQALEAAVEMQRAIAQLNLERRKARLSAIKGGDGTSYRSPCNGDNRR